MTSLAVRRAKAEGFETTGHTSRGSWDKEKVLAHVEEYKVMGNKVKVLLDRSETQFRDRKDVHTYYVLMVKYSEEYRAFKKQEQAARELARRESALRRMADECTLEEIQFMLNFKVASIMQDKLNALAEVNAQLEVTGEVSA